MKWFEGDVIKAARLAKEKNILVFVFVCGSDSTSQQMSENFDRKDTSSVCENNCVSIKLDPESQLAKQFCQIYQLQGVPSIFLIGKSGIPLDVIRGSLDPESFTQRLKKAISNNGSTYSAPSSSKRNQSTKGDSSSTAEPMETDTQNPSQPAASAAPSKCRIQFRLADGSSTSDAFSPSSSLAEAWNTICQKLGYRKGDFNLAMAHPRRNFDAEDMNKSLLELGLVPSAVILVLPSGAVASGGGDGMVGKLISSIVTLLLGMWNFVMQLIGGGRNGNDAQGGASSQPKRQEERDQESYQAKRSRLSETSEIRRRKEGNITRLSALRKDDSDDEATWNGNSTQQM